MWQTMVNFHFTITVLKTFIYVVWVCHIQKNNVSKAIKTIPSFPILTINLVYMAGL